jgi:hypothetical protein
MSRVGERFAIFVLLASGIASALPRLLSAQDYRYTADHAKLIYGVSASAHEPTVLAFVSGENEGEDVSGTPTIIDLQTLRETALRKLETMAIDANVVWTNDQRHVVFESLSGIFEVNLDEKAAMPKKLVSGQTHGLALSQSGSRMAYWNMEGGAIDLIVREVATSRTVRAWKLPFVYGGDASGFEIAFIGDDAVYARTFDKMDATPLKRFDVQSGKSQTIVSDCFSLASSENGLYFIANGGRSQMIDKLDGTSVILIANAQHYLMMRSSGRKWIALKGSSGSALLDTGTGQIINETKCDEVAVLAGDLMLYVKGNSLSTSTAVCVAPRSGHAHK